jgi:hypothetical protein
MSDTSIEPIEEVAETVEEATAAAAKGKEKKPCTPEKLKHLTMMRKKAAEKKAVTIVLG